MSQFPPILQLQEADLKKMLACNAHIGNTNLASGHERYVHGRNEAGNHIIDLRKTWQKLVLLLELLSLYLIPETFVSLVSTLVLEQQLLFPNVPY